jgi:hypothetical protein
MQKNKTCEKCIKKLSQHSIIIPRFQHYKSFADSEWFSGKTENTPWNHDRYHSLLLKLLSPVIKITFYVVISLTQIPTLRKYLNDFLVYQIINISQKWGSSMGSKVCMQRNWIGEPLAPHNKKRICKEFYSKLSPVFPKCKSVLYGLHIWNKMPFLLFRILDFNTLRQIIWLPKCQLGGKGNERHSPLI